MKAVVDANILFSCFLKDGVTRHLWFNAELELIAPEFIVSEFKKYRAYLQGKYVEGFPPFDKLVDNVLKFVKLVPLEELKPYLPAAEHLSNDDKDWLYLACALKENAIIWSNDKEFKKQARVGIKTTKELVAEIGLL